METPNTKITMWLQITVYTANVKTLSRYKSTLKHAQGLFALKLVFKTMLSTNEPTQTDWFVKMLGMLDSMTLW